MRFTYSVTTGSVMNLVLFSISMAYILPILISVSFEYQLLIPRPPMSRLPTAFTSSMEPVFALVHWLPGSITLSGLTLTAGVSPLAGAVPGAVLEEPGDEGTAARTSPPTAAVPGAGSVVGAFGEGAFAGVVDCAQAIATRASTNPASNATREALRTILTASPPAQIYSRSLGLGNARPHSHAEWTSSQHCWAQFSARSAPQGINFRPDRRFQTPNVSPS